MSEKMIVYKDLQGTEIKLSSKIIKTYLIDNKNISDSEINYFLALCKARQLNPFIKDVYLIKYNDKPAQIVVSKDALEKRALKNPMYDGKKIGITVKTEDGKIERRNGCIYDKSSEKLLGAWCEVYRKDWKNPAVSEVNIDEYLQYKNDGTINSMWASKPVTMLTKVAKAQALREAFIEDLQGMYNEEEIGIETSELKEVSSQIMNDNLETVEEIL